MANAIRALAMDAVEAAGSGHPGMPMGMADVATVLFTRYLKFDPAAPDWPDRDRFVLSAGHGSMLLYALLHLTGHADMTMDEIGNFRRLGSRTAGHPEHGHAAGVEATTGPLGQGFANAVGMALAERVLNARFGGLVDHRTYVVAGDGCLMEGISHEAASLAGHLRLDRLTVLFDDNGVSIDGPTSLAQSDDTIKRFEAYGWGRRARRRSRQTRPSRRRSTAPGRATGPASSPAGQPSASARPTSRAPPPPTARRWGPTRWPPRASNWTGRTSRSSCPTTSGRPGARPARAAGAARRAWEDALAACDGDLREEFLDRLAGDVSETVRAAVAAHVEALIAEPRTVATRKASELALEVLTRALPRMIGGSADLTGSNNTRAKAMKDIAAGDYGGSYVRYGVREHAMAAAMNGMALHGGAIPYGGTFLVFTDYCRPSIRLAALMGLRVIFVATHDSIGLAKTARRTSRSSISPACAQSPISTCSARRTRSRPPSAGNWRWPRARPPR